MLIAVVAIGTIVCVLTSNWKMLLEIVSSKGNGILGRFTTAGAGNFVYDINYLVSGGVPTGFVFEPNLFYTDCGVLVYILRGGLVLPILIYVLLYKSLKYYLVDAFNSKYIFIYIICFEVGYAALTAQRFLPLLLFFLLYNKMLANGQRSIVDEFDGEKNSK